MVLFLEGWNTGEEALLGEEGELHCSHTEFEAKVDIQHSWIQNSGGKARGWEAGDPRAFRL